MADSDGSGPFGLYSLAECAQALGISAANLREFKRAGVVQPTVLNGRQWWAPDNCRRAIRQHLGLDQTEHPPPPSP